MGESEHAVSRKHEFWKKCLAHQHKMRQVAAFKARLLDEQPMVRDEDFWMNRSLRVPELWKPERRDGA